MQATTTAIDRQAAKIAEWMRVLLRPGQVVEIRALDPFASRVFDTAKEGEVESLGQFAAQCSQRAKGVYYTPNPLKPAPLSGSGGSALDADVLSRAWLLVDCDPRQAKKVNATTAERVATLAAIQAVSDTLTAMGFAGIVHGDSGNGYHLMIPVELPNDGESYRMHADFLRHLEERFGTTFAEFDQKVKNAARIWKVPATVARKGPPSDERPHRFARLIHVPDDPHRFAQSNVEALKKLLALWQFRATDPPKAGGDDRAKLVERAAKYVCRKDVAVQGQNGSDRCYHVACTLVCRFGLTQEEAFEAIQNWNGQCQPPWSERELRHKIADAAKQPITGDLASGRAAPGPQASANGTAQQQPPKSNPDDKKPVEWEVQIDGEVVAEGDPAKWLADESRLWSDSRAKEQFELLTLSGLLGREFPAINWVVPGILSEGLNILAGKPKLGKSMLSLNLGITVASGGKALGDVQTACGDVLYLALEDRGQRLQARARRMMRVGDVEINRRLKIATRWPRQDQGGLDLIVKWARQWCEERPALVIVDVWNKFRTPSSPRGNAYEQDYQAISQLKAIADEMHFGALVVHHCRKSQGADVLEEISGTMGLSGAADGIMALTRTRGDNEARVFVTGRDVNDQELALRFDPETLTWVSMGNANDVSRSRIKTKIVEAFRASAGATFFVTDMARQIEEKEDSVLKAMARMAEEGILRRVGRKYGWPANPSDDEAAF